MADLPGAVHLVAQTPALDLVGFGDSILAPQFAPARALVQIAVFHQGSRLLRGSRAQIQTQQRFCPRQTAPGEKLVRSKLVRVHRIPRFVQYRRTICSRADAVEPVVSGYKISAGIANDGNAEFTDFFENILAKAVGVREFGLRVVDAFVDGPAEVFEERAKHFPTKGGKRSPRIGVDSYGLVRIRRGRLAEQVPPEGKVRTHRHSHLGCFFEEFPARNTSHFFNSLPQSKAS